MAYNEVLYGDGHQFNQAVSYAGTQFIARFEQWVPKWYPDGTWREGPKKGEPKYSCCYGHQEGGDNPPFTYAPDQTFTVEQGLAIFKSDLQSKARAVRNRLEVKVNTYQFNALLSLLYNYGQGSVDKVNSVFPLLNQELYVAASVGFLACNKFQGVEKNGLTVRRACEIAMFTTRVMKG